MITLEALNRLFEFDLETGTVTYKVDRYKCKAGDIVGWVDENGYRRTKFRGQTYFLHKLIWYHVYGTYPSELDHRDGDPSNNSISNLRVATRTQNLGNANIRTGVSGTRGVHMNSERSKWRSMIHYGGRAYFLGDYNTKEEAAAVYRKAAEELYGEFALHNRPRRI